MAKKPPNDHKPWTRKDISMVRDLASQNTPTGLIAYHTGRSKPAVYSLDQTLLINNTKTCELPRAPKILFDGIQLGKLLGTCLIGRKKHRVGVPSLHRRGAQVICISRQEPRLKLRVLFN